MKKTINILIRFDNRSEPVNVDATPITLEGYEAFEFALHRTYLPADSKQKPSWTLTELSTGLAVCKNGCTKSEAVKLAKEKLDRYGGEPTLKKLIADTLCNQRP